MNNIIKTFNIGDRINIFIALLLLSLSLAFALSSVFSDFWIYADSLTRNGTISENNQMNSGLFHGIRQIDWSFGPKRNHFSVFDEIRIGVAFIDKHIWFGILLSTGLGLLWNLTGIFVALRNATLYNNDPKNERTALGPLGICLWSVLSAVAYGFCVLLFHYQFLTKIRHNVLLPEENDAGFSSENCIHYGFSFILMIAAFLSQKCTFLLVFFTLRGKSVKVKKCEKEKSDNNIFIY
uniref:Uncharacterized protein n=1 Tax=Meloidogyne enterolobii TaxID=390850 RepID=A0A6V7VIM8_MELEN|nr:unnamed protein product [Meloidogyne enterolobii]